MQGLKMEISSSTGRPWVREIRVPLFMHISRGLDGNRLLTILEHEGIDTRRPMLISGSGITRVICSNISHGMECLSIGIDSSSNRSMDTVAGLLIRHIMEYDPTFIAGVGGGRVLDAAKYAAHTAARPLISIPTALSHDGIASPIVVARFGDGSSDSMVTTSPAGILLDLDIVRRAPRQTTLAGIGDLVSNLSAVQDWRLASEHTGVKIDLLAEMLSRNAAERFIYYVLKNHGHSNGSTIRGKSDDAGVHRSSTDPLLDDDLLVCLAEGLVQSGIAMSIAGSSRPASGAEHLISHALDRILEHPRPHGIQVGFATVFAMALRGSEFADITHVYEALGFPTTLDSMGISLDEFLHAVRLAPYTRKGRFTILDIVGYDDIINAIRLAYNVR
ncbi:MAG: iron-containing alcohol dehydrogenase [Candidatus Nitrosocaldus sp.]|nr:iron-containing alcohol dehydrogenase [Candidatus Nitrosocaldus sp.]MDW8275260.1 iron-containing alcohol dehydrogenase [Candidatus Nitrosocaldus sp.]